MNTTAQDTPPLTTPYKDALKILPNAPLLGSPRLHLTISPLWILLLLVCMWWVGWVCACHGMRVEVRGQLRGIGSHLPLLCEFQGWNLGCLAGRCRKCLYHRSHLNGPRVWQLTTSFCSYNRNDNDYGCVWSLLFQIPRNPTAKPKVWTFKWEFSYEITKIMLDSVTAWFYFDYFFFFFF